MGVRRLVFVGPVPESPPAAPWIGELPFLDTRIGSAGNFWNDVILETALDAVTAFSPPGTG